MDPAEGRRWVTCRQLLEELYVHSLTFPADAWRDWAASDRLRDELANLGIAVEDTRDGQRWRRGAELTHG